MLKNVQASGKPGTFFYSSNPSRVEVFLLFFISEMISLKFLRGAVLTSLLQFLGNILEDWLWSVLNNRVWQSWTSCQWIFFVENSLFSCHLWSSLMFIRSLCHLTRMYQIIENPLFNENTVPFYYSPKCIWHLWNNSSFYHHDSLRRDKIIC